MANLALVLPYVTEDSGRRTYFSENMEVAALLCLAEVERKKRGVLRRTEENLVCLSKLHYPLWAIPWKNKCLLVDGMALASSKIGYAKPPNIENFVEHLKRSTTVYELYHSTLRSHRETFSKFTSQTESHIVGYITDLELLSDLSQFIQERRTELHKETPNSNPIIHPRIGEERAKKIGGRIQEHYIKLQSEIKGLQFANHSLNQETEKHIEKLQQELKQIREFYESEISTTRREIQQTNAELHKELDDKITKIIESHEKEVGSRLSEKKRWERELLRLEQNKSEYKKRKELRRRKNDEVGETRWDAKLRATKNEISTVKGKITALSKFIKRSDREMEKTTKELQNTYQRRIKEVGKQITKLENLRDSKLDKKRKEIENLKQATLAILNQLKKLVEHKRTQTTNLKQATVPWKAETITLMHLPFYFIKYKAKEKTRYRLHPPTIARGHRGLLVRIRKAFKGCKGLLKPRAKHLEKSINALQETIVKDKAIRMDLNQLAMANNLLKFAEFKEKVEQGLGSIETEGWINAEEKAAILESYAEG